MRLIILSLACIGFLISDRCHVRFATLVDNKRDVRDDLRVHMNQLENCQARYRSNTWMSNSHRRSLRVRANEVRLYIVL